MPQMIKEGRVTDAQQIVLASENSWRVLSTRPYERKAQERKTPSRNRGGVLKILLVLLVLINALPGYAQDDDDEFVPPPLLELNESNIKQATVFLMQVYDVAGGTVISCVGSGTLVSANGLILTNAHNAVESDVCQSDRVVVSLTLRLDEPPVPTYIAEVLDYSEGLDIAVLKITRYLDGRVVEAGTLQLPFVEIGDSNRVNLDDTILIAGYPDIGNSAVETIADATISGFTAEARVGSRAWLRTNAPIPGGMSGGGAYDSTGRLIGIPTIAPARVGGEIVDCRRIGDSTGDGQVNEEDSCIPIGGFISALRPSRLVRGLVRAAALGIRTGEDRFSAETLPPSNPPEFSRLFMSTGVNAAGQPVNVVTGLPSGATSAYLFFDYRNLVNGLVYELRTTIDGRPSSPFSLPPVTWNGGQRGMWYIGSAGIPWPNGTYEFTLFIEGRQIASHQMTVGGGPQQLPAISDIAFGLQDSNGSILGTNYVVPEGNIVRAQFNYRNMTPNLEWTQVWYLEDTELARIDGVWAEAVQGVSTNASIASETLLLSGRYRLELYVQGNMVATSDFVIAGGAQGIEAQIFSNLLFAGRQVAGFPQPPVAMQFATGLEQLYVFFNWRQISPNTPWTWRWKVDSDTLFESNTTWTAAPTGENYYLSIVGVPNLPDGTYTFEIEMGGIVIESVQARVGLGQLPIDAFASAEGVQMSGYIRDAETNEGIPGAMFILLLPEFDTTDFVWDETQILALALADSEGYFQLPILLPRGTTEEPVLYSLVVRADGYLPMAADGIAVTDATESPLELNVELNRD